MKYFLIVLFWINMMGLLAQTSLSGTISSGNTPIVFASVALKNTPIATYSDSLGKYTLTNLPSGKQTLLVYAIGYNTLEKTITIPLSSSHLDIKLVENATELKEVVVSGTMKEVSKLDSPVPVEVYTANFFKSNPTPSIFESLQNINGVRPQLNCNVCNTGDIHINGLEGPYTMILIDGMPIVSGLSTVYGLTGIPQSLIERVEIVKGPASTLYGSEAVGGLINIITKKPLDAPVFSADIFSSNWRDVNMDLGIRSSMGKNVQSLLGINYFNYQNPVDNNKDGFTDVTLQNRISVFNKWNISRKNQKTFTLAARYNYEDRWGGDMRWNSTFRGGDSLYGESIYTNRWECYGTYQLPTTENIRFSVSANGHYQNSYYGTTFYDAQQTILFGQLTWNKQITLTQDLMVGLTHRYTYYDDNTPATATFDSLQVKNYPSKILLPGLFIQNEISLRPRHTLLLGLRYDYNSIHGNVFTPRFNYKVASKNEKNILRLSSGSGYRVANVFTEDHAALTGARQVVFADALKPETSWNVNLNFVKKMCSTKGVFVGLDATAFYTYFSNRIIPDYTTDPNKIIYSNLNGHAISQGLSLNIDVAFQNGLKILAGMTAMDVNFTDNGITQRQLLTERYTGVWSVGYKFKKVGLSIDYTGNIYGPMLLPLLGDLDDRAASSPIWSLQNIQLTQKLKYGIEIYGGVKNLLNYTPPANSIARSFDPFDKQVSFDTNGQVIPTTNNPNALTFDPTYVFAPNQGIRAFLGIRWNIY